MSGILFPKPVHQSAPAIASLQLQTSSWGRPIPLVYGMTRVAGNLIWYGDFKATPHTQRTGGKGGGGGSTSTTYTYTAGAVLGLCYGPIGGIPRAWANKDLTSISKLGLSVAIGANGQAPAAFLSSLHPSEALGYSYTATVSSSAYELGETPSLPAHNFEIQGPLYGSAGVSGIPDAAIDRVLTDLLYDSVRGVGFTPGKLGDLSALALYCKSLGLWVSPNYDAGERAADIVDRLCKIANTAPVFSDGVLKMIPMADAPVSGNGASYSPNLAPVYNLTDDDFKAHGAADPVVVVRSATADAFNQVKVSFRDRAKDYADNVVDSKDDSAIAQYGLRPDSTVTLTEINDASTARMVAQLLLQRRVYQRNKYKFTLGIEYVRLEPMDIVRLTESTGAGLNGVAVRITSITETADLTYEIEAEDILGTVGGAPLYNYQLPGGYQVNLNVAPGPVLAPLIFDAPGVASDTGFEIWVAASGSSPNWGGATVWLSTDNATYTMVGTLEGPSRYGTLTAPFAAGSDPDTVDTLSVDISGSRGTLQSGTQADADNAITDCLVGGEVITYQTATLTGAGQYTLGTYLRRGVYGTNVAAHVAGESFARLDDSIFRIPYDPSLVGKTIYLKFTSVNIFGGAQESLGSVAPYAYTIAGPLGSPAQVTGATATATNDGILLQWTANASPNVKQYEIRSGASWAAATFVGKSLTTLLKVPPVPLGTSTWLIKALDNQGRYSNNATSIVFTCVAPAAPSLSSQVVDNNVLLSWTQVSGSQPILTYEVRKGATWAGATLIGTKNGLFTSVFETAAGSYTYWVAAIDIGGNYGTPVSTTATVAAPPDFVLAANVTSSFGGALSSAIVDHGSVVLPVDTAATWTTHFTGNSWTSPQDQINAGFPIFVEKSLASGYYEEFLDKGNVLASAKVIVTLNGAAVAGAPTVQCDISTSPDNVTYTTFSNVFSAYATNFRYVKARITITGSGGAALYQIAGLNVRLESKLKTDQGSVSAVSTDSGGTVVTFNQTFLSVAAINITPLGTTPVIAVVNFAGGANPTTFQVLLFNTSGARISGPVHWEARGY